MQRQQSKVLIKQNSSFTSQNQSKSLNRFNSRKTIKSTNEDDDTIPKDLSNDINDETNELSKEQDLYLIESLKEILNEYSLQRLRALQMNLRKLSSTDNRIQLKDLNQSLNELSIKISPKILNDLCAKYTDKYGIDYESMYKYLFKIHTTLCTNDLAIIRQQRLKGNNGQIKKETYPNLLKRILNQFQTLTTQQAQLNFNEFKIKINERCSKHRSQLLAQKEIQKLLDISGMPIYGALLDVLFDRTQQNNLISSNKFVNILEEAFNLNIESQLENLASNPQSRQQAREQLKKEEDKKEVQEIENKVLSKRETTLDILEEHYHDDEHQENDSALLSNEITNTAKKEILLNNQVESIKLKINADDEIIIPKNNLLKEELSDINEPNVDSIDFEWIYGYTNDTTEHNKNILSITFTNEIAYSAGSSVVLLNLDKKRQRFYLDHLTKITCLQLYFNGMYLISVSQKTSTIKSCIKLWRIDSLKTIKTLLKETIGDGNVISIDSSRSSAERLLILEEFNKTQNEYRYKITIADITKDYKIASIEIDTQQTKLTQIGLNVKDETQFITIGHKEHLVFWKLNDSDNEIKEQFKANYQQNMKAECISTFVYRDNGDLITGDSNGNIYLWGYNTNFIKLKIKHAHYGLITNVLLHSSFIITSGNQDNKIYGWSLNASSFGDHSGALQLPFESFKRGDGSIKSILFHKQDHLIVASTRRCLLNAKKITSDLIQENPLNNFIFDESDLNLSDCGSSKLRFLSKIYECNDDLLVGCCGLDGLFSLIDLKSHSIRFKKRVSLKFKLCCCDFYLNNERVICVFGTLDGHVLFADIAHNESPNENDLIKLKLFNNEITVVQLSPDRKFIATSNKSGTLSLINVYQENNQTKLILNGTFKDHKTQILGLDWSTDFCFLKSSSLNKLFILKTTDLSPVNNLSNDTQWKTSCSLYSHENIGLITFLNDKNLLNSFLLDIDNDAALIIDPDKLICYLFKYPTSLRSKFKQLDLSTFLQSNQIQINSVKLSNKLKQIIIGDSKNNIIYQFKYN